VRETRSGPINQPSVVIPDDREVFRFAAEWVGEPATGTPAPIPPEFVTTWLKQMNGRTRGWPLQWERSLIADWREQYRRGWGHGQQVKKYEMLDLRTQAEALDGVLREHPGNPESSSYAGSNADQAVLDEFKALRKKRRKIAEQISNGGIA
jgi:hypothetical protein